jgi:micrococcal nuclease
MRSLLSVGVAVLLLTTACVSLDDVSPPDDVMARSAAHVTQVVDGDTIHVALDGADTTVRLIGIDTPEKQGPYTQLECYGNEATAFTTHLLEGEDVALEFDVERTDRFDRTLAYVWLRGDLANEEILRAGYGLLLTIPPNVAYAERLQEAQREAREAGRGLWGACPSR